MTYPTPASERARWVAAALAVGAAGATMPAPVGNDLLEAVLIGRGRVWPARARASGSSMV